MADDVLVDAYDAEHQPSTPLASSDSESANTSTSRVYFGPVQSAEKRHIRPREQAEHTPIRRSTRHLMGSSLALRIPKDDGEEYSDPSANEVVASDLSRPDTPTILEDALEEPSSALASKVLSACGNPSPPPSPLLPSRGDLKDANDAATDEDNAEILLLPLEDNYVTQLVAQESITENAHIPEPVQSDQPVEAQADEVDLINFDSFASPPAPLVHLLPATPPRGAAPCSVDDLLAPTPMRLPSSEMSSPTARLQNTAGAQEDAPSIEEVQPSPGAAIEAVRQDSPPGIQPSAPVQTAAAEPGSLLEPTAHTPLRRSTRPRRSVSPYVSVTPSKTGQSASSSPKVEVGSVRRKRTKANEPDSGERLLKALDFSSSNLAVEIPRTLEDVSSNDIADSAEHGQRSTPDAGLRKGKEVQTPENPRLRSLSPTSTSLLSRLLSPSNTQHDGATTQTESGLLNTATPKKVPSDDAASTFPPFCLDDQVPERPSTPTRDASPQRKEVARTPARRIPLSEAIAQGTVSPVKASMFASSQANSTKPAPGLTFFNPRSGGEVVHSPAKRVPIGEVMPFLQSPSKQTTRPTSPAKSSHVRSMSEDPIQPIVPKFKRSMSAEPVRPTSSAARPGELRNRAGLSQGSSHESLQRPSEPSHNLLNIPPSIQESDEPEPQQPSQAKPKPSSSLRPPSSRVESKIPRPGSKPYARPAPVSAAKPTPRIVPSVPKKTLPNASTSAAANVPAAQAIRPMRMVRRVVSNKPPVEVSSGSDDMPQPVAGPGPRTASSRLGKPPSKPSPPSVDATTLKRKREADEAESSRASPVGVKPVVLIRKVPPPPPRIGRPTAAPPTSRPASIKPSPPSKSPGPVVVNGGLKLRKAVGKRKPESPARSPPPPKPDSPMDVVPPSPPTQNQALHQPSSPAHHEAHETHVDIVVDIVTDAAAPAAQLPPDVQATQAATDATVAPPSTDGTSETETDAASHGLRRGSRPRKAPTTDVFGVVAPLRGAGSKRRTILLPDTSVFSGMSAIALKSLTNTNTQRNQRQVVEIHTEVVLKEGKRPDSPTTKVRTSLERQREERVKEREERAARRARRSEGEGDLAPEEDPGDVSLLEVDVEMEMSVPLGHPRAPGDEEDYTTPERPRPAKRSRLGEVLEERDGKHEKRVKWNHGLATTVYLNDTPPKPKRPPSDAPVKKGCLAPSAKARPLDTMGNVLNAEAPVPDVQPENIVVKKFVYEDDETPVAAEPAPAPAPAKSTRSKNKKSRT